VNRIILISTIQKLMDLTPLPEIRINKIISRQRGPTG
jgi:hypothetical protein